MSGSTLRTPVKVLVKIGGSARASRAMKVGKKPRPLSMNGTRSAIQMVIGSAMATIPNEGSALPMLTIVTAANPPRPVWPIQAPNGTPSRAAMPTAAPDTCTCSHMRLM